MQKDMILIANGRGQKMGNYFSPFSLRIPEELLEKIKVIAEKNKRSANKEIEFIISEYVCAYEEKNGTIKTTAE